MKKVIMVLGLVGAMGVATAQESKTKVEIGAKAGMNVANVNYDVDYGMPDTEEKIGLSLGAYAEIQLSDRWSVQPEILYSEQGFKQSGYLEGDFPYGDSELPFEGNVEITEKINYLKVPVMMKYYTGEGRKFFLEAGPELGINISSKAKTELDGYSNSTRIKGSNTTDIKDYIEGVDFALNFGLGYKFNDKFNIGIRWGFGLIDFDKSEDEQRNYVGTIGVGYTFWSNQK